MPRYFWLLLVIFTMTFGILFLDHFRTYSSQVTILVVHKNEKTSASADQVIHNIMAFPKTLAFYERLLKQFPEVKDPWVGMGADERRALWAERVFVERVDDSGLIHLRISADTETDAKLLAEKSAATLFRMIGQYYNIRTEIDIRTIDPPIASVAISNPFGFFLASLSAGFVVAVIISTSILVFSRSMGRVNIRELLSKKENVQSDLMPVTFGTLPEEKTSVEKTELYKIPTPPSFAMPIPTIPSTPTLTKTATPSSNLPFLEEGVSLEEHLFGTRPMETLDTIEKADTTIENSVTESLPVVHEDASSAVIATQEPTAEELKRRLNQLLKGEL